MSAEVGASSITVGKALLNLSEVLIFPQNKIQLDTRVMSIDTECRAHAIKSCSCQGSATRRKHLGNLSVWFRLTCEMDALKAHAEQFWIDGMSSEGAKGAQKKRVKIKKQSDTDRDVENSSRSGFSLTDSEETFVDKKHKKQLSTLQPNEIAITVGNLILLGDSDIIQNSSIKSIYIEYNFHGTNESQSIDLRKVISKSSTTTTAISFGFRKVLAVNPNADDRIRHRLLRLLKNDEKNIKFIIVGEQTKRNRAHKHNDDNDCLEMALGLLHLGKVLAEVETNRNGKNVQIPMMSKNHPYKNVGHLEITVEGIVFMKKLISGDC